MYNKIEIIENEIRPTLIEAHIADIHFGALDPEYQYKLLREQFIEKLLKLPVLDILCIDGDMYDHKNMSNSRAVQYGNMFISDCIMVCKMKNASFIIINGTREHEMDQLRQYYHYLSDSEVDIRIIETISMENIKGANVLCIPELYDTDESIVQQKLHSMRYDAVFMHGTVEGAVYGDNSGSSRLFRMSDFSDCLGPIISGHVHTPVCLHSHFYYTGCPYRWRFGQEEQKGFILLAHNLQTHTYYTAMEFIESYRFDTISVDQILSSDPKDTINYINRIKEEQGIDFIRVTFNTEVNQDMTDIMKSYYKNNKAVKLDFKFDKKIEEIKRNSTEIKEYEEYKYLFDKSLDKYDILARYINQQEGYVVLTSTELKNIVEKELF